MHDTLAGRLERPRALGRKLRRSWRDHTLGTKLRRQATNILVAPVVSAVRNARLSPEDRSLDIETGFRDHRRTSRELTCSDTAFKRLIEAFNGAEADGRRSCPRDLEVHGVWAEWLELHYGRLRHLLRQRDVHGLRLLLENVHRESMSTGVGGTRDDVGKVPSPLVPAYYRALWTHHRDLLAAVRPDWSDVASPIVGNPHGAWVDGRLVQVETLEKAYYATVLLEIVGKKSACRAIEIGAGMGGQAYQLLRLGQDAIQSYTIFDLPEVACLSAYCLMGALGERRVRLFGEGSPADDDVLVEIQPHWLIERSPDRSADLVFNSYSFSEMDSSSSSFYLREIERICAANFFHVNHETRFRYRRPDGSESVTSVGSEIVPDPKQFSLSRRQPRAFVRPENRANLAFDYLYQRLPVSG